MDSDLLQKLHRQRVRMGETGSPFRRLHDGEHSSRTSVSLDCEVHVKQRALKFQQVGERQEDMEAFERGMRPCTSGRVNLERWEVPRGTVSTAALPQVVPAALPASPAPAPLPEAVLRRLPTPCRSSRRERPVTPPPAALPEAAAGGGEAAAGSPSSPRAPPAAAAEEEPSPPLSTPGSCEYWAEAQAGASEAAAKAVVQLLEKEGAGFETQVLRPLRDWLAPGGASAEAACFSMAGGEPSEADCEEVGEDRLTEGVLERGTMRDGHEPLEYDLLDYLGQLPEGLVGKLKGSMEMHEELVQQLCKRFQTLQAKARTREAAALKGAAPRGRCATLEAQDEWRRELRAQMAGRVLVAQEARLRLAAEAHEAAMRAKLECPEPPSCFRTRAGQRRSA